MTKYIDSLYQWTMAKASHPKSSWFLAFISFIESSIFPIPPDIILILMVISNRAKSWIYAIICTVSSVLGGIIGYLIGAFFFGTIGVFILETYNLIDNFDEIKNYYYKYGIWIVLIGGLTPFPYKLITISSGFFSLSLPIFILMSFVSRGTRFFIVTLLLWYFGPSIKVYIEKHLSKLTILFLLLLIAGFLLIKLL